MKSKKIKSIENHTVNFLLVSNDTLFVGMTESSTKSYRIENHCFNPVILKVFPLRTRKAKNNF